MHYRVKNIFFFVWMSLGFIWNEVRKKNWQYLLFLNVWQYLLFFNYLLSTLKKLSLYHFTIRNKINNYNCYCVCGICSLSFSLFSFELVITNSRRWVIANSNIYFALNVVILFGVNGILVIILSDLRSFQALDSQNIAIWLTRCIFTDNKNSLCSCLYWPTQNKQNTQIMSIKR